MYKYNIITVNKTVRLLLTALFLFIISCGSEEKSENHTKKQTYVPQKQTYSENVINGTITVTPGHVAYPVIITPEMSNPRLAGSFTASGGSGNDICVYVMDETNYINWKNGHGGSCYYKSGQLTTSSFNVRIPIGKFYIVYDNSFSTFSNKNVSTRVDLQYEK